MARAARRMRKFRELKVDQLRSQCELKGLRFATTEDVKPLDEVVGQKRALKAIEAGLGITSHGYNIYVSGLVGTGRTSTIQSILQRIDRRGCCPPDYCYVHNFKEADRPLVLRLDAGKGRGLRVDMEALIDHLKQEVPKAFEKEEYDQKRQEIAGRYAKEEERLMVEFREKAHEKQFEVLRAPAPHEGLMLVPLIDGKPVPDLEQAANLTEEKVKEVQQRQEELQAGLAGIFREGRRLKKKLVTELEQLDQTIGLSIIKHPMEELHEKYPQKDIRTYLDEVQEDIVKNLDRFRRRHEDQVIIPGLAVMRPPDTFIEYQVNVVVDNSGLETAPVVVETAPTYINLFGTVEKVVDPHGRLVSDFSRIKAGSLLRANGGYLVLNMEDALTEPGVWKNLKRTLKAREAVIQTYDPFSIFSVSAIKPEPIELNVKIVTIGGSWLYYLLYEFDEDFKKLFKIRADFGSDYRRTVESERDYVRFIAKTCRDEKLPPFDRTGVAAVIEYGMRQTENQKKLSARFSDIADLVREASFWATRMKSKAVTRQSVERALDEKIERVNRVEEIIQELIEEGKLMIDVKGAKVGQVNGLSLYDMGEFVFGRPSRITAQTSMGRAGIINIEREAELSGRTHSKGVLILGGYLRGRYAQDKPLALSASICFEQSYSGVEGDSASSTELYALLSSLSELPIRQGIGVTGSVNQRGEIQPIGGVNYKVEGFFSVCKAMGLTGDQGVIVPHQNAKDLMLRNEVVEAVEKGRFHIYPVKTIDEGIEILTGVRAGSVRAKDTVNGRVNRRLAELAKGLKDYEAGAEGGKRTRPARERGTLN